MAARSIVLLLGGHVDPASLAAQIAAIDDRDVEKRRKDFAPLQPPLVLLHRADAAVAHVQASFHTSRLSVSQQHALGHLQIHGDPLVECGFCHDRRLPPRIQPVENSGQAAARGYESAQLIHTPDLAVGIHVT